LDRLQLIWADGTTAVVPALWLRDNCPCSHCKVVATSERRKLIATEPLELAPVSVVTDTSGVTVDWGNHVSHYTLDWYRAIQLDTRRHLATPSLWGPDFTLPRFRYSELDESVPGGRQRLIEFLSAFTSHGVACVSGVPIYQGESERFVSRWAPIRELPFGRVHDVLVDPMGYNIAHTAEALPPHTDFPSYKWPPSGQALHMLINEVVGGDSFVVDGWRVASELDRSELDILASFPVPFRQFDHGAETWTMAPLLRLRPDGSIEQLRFSNQLMQPIDPATTGIDRFYEAYHHLSTLLLAPEQQHRFRMQPGDLLVVHGHRVLHGRTAYEASTGHRHLQDVYFEFEDLFNQLHRLSSIPARAPV